jgi:16S rRNA (adenine1518-N6/adenine1519-N6)-dimethyltransferase
MGTRLGQNFLKNPQIAAKIAEAANLTPQDIVLEVGPGRGILTTELLARARRVIAVEKDGQLVAFLKGKFAAEIATGKLILVGDDILKIDFQKLMKLKANEAKNYKVVANIPYYITAHLLRHFLEAAHQPESMTLMIQKEVATRLAAKPPRMNLLALSVQVYGTPKTAFIVKRGSFIPPPKVDSAVITIGHISHDFFKGHKIKETDFFALLHAGFAQKRKMLAGNIAKLAGDKKLATALLVRCGIKTTARAETLLLEQWATLTKAIST